MRSTLIPLCLLIGACSKEPVEVPVVVERKLAPKPPECSTKHPDRLAPMPKAKDGDRVEDYVAAAGRVHRLNDKQYRTLRSDHSVCDSYVGGLFKSAGGN